MAPTKIKSEHRRPLKQLAVTPYPHSTVPGAEPLHFSGFKSTTRFRPATDAGKKPAKHIRQSLSFSTDTPYNVKPVIITEGALAGKKAFVLLELSYTFTDIPPEVRAIIYDLIFRHDHPFAMYRKRYPTTTQLQRGVHYAKGVLPTCLAFRGSRSKVSMYTDKKWASLRGQLGLLRASKLIHEEASAVLYGHNSFLLSARDIEAFFTQIGHHSSLIRNMVLSDIKINSGKTGLSRLSLVTTTCAGLRTIKLQHSMICGKACQRGQREIKWEGDAEACFGTSYLSMRRLLKGLWEQRGHTDKLSTIAGIFHVAPSDEHCKPCADGKMYVDFKHNEEYHEAKEHCELVEQKLQQIIEAELHLIIAGE